MSSNKIEWTQHTWNPVIGCSKISEGCQNCYAQNMAQRLQSMGCKGYENSFEMFESIINQVGMSLSKRRLNLSDEKLLQNDIASAFDHSSIAYEREVKIKDKSIVDFMIGTLAIEVKIRGNGSAMSIYRQIERYCDSDQVEAILLLTSKTMTLPETINGKAVYVLSLGKTQL
ncbi:DUF5131 family protein [Sulfurospirillum multivorans]|uniref:Phage protein n=2 Tax=Sulfurospirillum multivorans TaxID=66821 RepID=A0AA86DZS3_SULMK|nr:DUF5131 family protein [Sulfurospirillum multivorans]AHJ13135.1 putative phage protein [Sulfurospirillum multivorans DSM 12446]QEH06623.1 putative phage protein [Sulfurospirillum multivorans]